MKRLTNLDVAEVSLVPRGANRKKFLVFKSTEGNAMAVNNEIANLINSVDPTKMAKITTILKGMKKAKKSKEDCEKAKEGEEGKGGPMEKSASGDLMPKKDSAAYKSKDKMPMKGKMPFMKDDMGGGEEVSMSDDSQPLSDRAQAALKAVARIIAPFKDEISDDHMDAVQNEVGIAPTESPDEATPKDDMEKVQMNMAIPEGVEEEHHMGALDTAKKSYMDHLEKMGYRKYPDPSLDETNAMEKSKHGDDDEEDEDEEDEKVGKSNISKSLDLSAFPKGQRDQLSMIFKANQDLVQKNADLEKELKIERDHRVMKEFQEKAKSFKHLGANTDEVATILKSLSETDQSSYKKVESILKAADNQIGMNGNLYREHGSRIAKSDGNDAQARLDALVDSVVHKSEGTKSREQLYDEVTRTAEGKRLLSEALNKHHEDNRRFGGAR